MNTQTQEFSVHSTEFQAQFKKTCKRLRALTQLNHHDEAYALGANLLNLDDLENKFNMIKCKCETDGFLSDESKQKRLATYQDLMSSAEFMLDERDYAKFYMCF
jgi:hypothetical protein